MKSLDALAYIVTQLLGGLLAAFLLKIAYGSFAQNVGVPTLAQPIKPLNGLLIEAVATFLLMMVIMGVAIDSRGTFSAVAGLPIGLIITAGILFSGPLTGGAMNPARWFGPAIASGQLTNFWIWILGPILGALAAVFLYDGLVKPKK
jgi:glycerol uptake facilitator-like aquaporin